MLPAADVPLPTATHAPTTEVEAEVLSPSALTDVVPMLPVVRETAVRVRAAESRYPPWGGADDDLRSLVLDHLEILLLDWPDLPPEAADLVEAHTDAQGWCSVAKAVIVCPRKPWVQPLALALCGEREEAQAVATISMNRLIRLSRNFDTADDALPPALAMHWMAFGPYCLVVTDVGREHPSTTHWPWSVIEALIDTRDRLRLPTILTTGLSPANLILFYGKDQRLIETLAQALTL